MSYFDQMDTQDYEQLVFCQDKQSGLRAIICIHDTTLGPALGGLRMYPYEKEEDAVRDVLRLARGMTYKAAAAGLNLGGGKAVIIGDPKTMKSEALFRSFGRFVQTLNGRYITAEDSGTTVNDMTYINMETNWVTGIMKSKGGSGDPSPVTARGTYNGIKACWNFIADTSSLRNVTIAVQGLGSVGYHLCKMLFKDGARLLVADINDVNVRRCVNEFKAEAIPPEDIHKVQCDIFAPCALGAVINDTSIEELQCKIVAGAANNQLAESRHGVELKEKGIIYAPDYVINAGGLMNVYEELAGYNQDRALKRVDQLFYRITNILETAREKNISSKAAADVVSERRINEILNVSTIWTEAVKAAGR